MLPQSSARACSACSGSERRLAGLKTAIAGLLVGLTAGCVTAPGPSGDGLRPGVYSDTPGAPKPQTIGIDPADLVTITDRMVKEMMESPRLGKATSPPRVVIDSAFFRLEGPQPLNKGLLVDRLRIELMRAAKDRMIFVHRDAVAEYYLVGTLKAMTMANPSTGQRSRYHQLTFEMQDFINKEVVWSGMYETTKTSVEDVIYR